MLKRGACTMSICGLVVALAAGGFVGARKAGAQQGGAQLLHPAAGPPPAFEVATIKPSQSNSGLTNYGIAEGRFRADNATTADLIKLAYDVRSDDQFEKGPDWTNSERFDIDAKIAEADAVALQKLSPTERFNQYRLMVQSLLSDRFKLKVSTRETVLPVYAMVVARNGPKLTATAPGKQHRHGCGADRGGSCMQRACRWFLCRLDFRQGGCGRASGGGRDGIERSLRFHAEMDAG